MQNDTPTSVPSDTQVFFYEGVRLAYSPETGVCFRADKAGEWWLVQPSKLRKYTQVSLTTNKQKGLHRIVAEVFLNYGKPLQKGQVVDHIVQVDGTHKQDRLTNLRICTVSENIGNRRMAKNNTSGYKGVEWHSATSKWRARLAISGKLQHLGYFTTPEAAAEAYDTAAIQHFGEFACTNVSLGLLNCVNLALA